MSRLILLSLFGRFAGPFLVPVKISGPTARSRGQGRPSGRRGTRLALDGGEPGCTLLANETIGAFRPVRRSRGLLGPAFGMALLAAASRSCAAPPTRAPAGDLDVEIARAVDEAALRFGVPHAWILAVMRVESDGRPGAISPKGAMGLLQLMPATWRDLSAELALGDDPYDVRANVLAGAAYLRRMYDRFGSPGFLAAYNAGPERYAQHLAGTRTLPRETQDYVRRLVPTLNLTADGMARASHPTPAASGLFVRPTTGGIDGGWRPSSSVQAAGLWP